MDEQTCKVRNFWLVILLRRELKGKREKERHTRLNAESQRTARKDKKNLLSEKCKEIEKKKNRMERLEIS